MIFCWQKTADKQITARLERGIIFESISFILSYKITPKFNSIGDMTLQLPFYNNGSVFFKTTQKVICNCKNLAKSWHLV